MADEIEIPPGLKQEFKRIFRELDANGDNRVSCRELPRAMQLFGMNPTRGEIDEIMATFDSDGDGYISFKEFEKFMCTCHRDLEYERRCMCKAFKVFDLDGNGSISKKELMMVLTRCGNNTMADDEAEEMIEDADTNGDGVISYEEFVQHMCGHPPYEEWKPQEPSNKKSNKIVKKQKK